MNIIIEHDESNSSHGYYVALGMGLCQIVYCLTNMHSHFTAEKCGLKLRSLLTAAVFNKVCIIIIVIFLNKFACHFRFSIQDTMQKKLLMIH